MFLVGGFKVFMKCSNFKGILLFIYIYKGYVFVYVEVIIRFVWCFFLMEFVRLVNKNKWMKEIKDWIYEWKM